MSSDFDDHVDDVRSLLEELNSEPSENKLRSVVKMLTGFSDTQLDDLGGFENDQPRPILLADHDRPVTDRVFGFYEVLYAADLLPPNPADYFEKPWKWQPEYEAWVAAGRPPVPDPPENSVLVSGDDPVDLNWERFVRTCERIQDI